ncbi:unnamed protein product [Larinioides sclopetarius]|uniref:Uncharacterized protein n=1 Tax=Larinioides sclopetarius TaxID=280406 RepID=A0AAV2BJE1_9ARAC
MVNAVSQIAGFLDNGANGLEFDIEFTTEGNASRTFHGVPCDCFRDCNYNEDFVSYLQNLRSLTTPGDPKYRKQLVLLFVDFKVSSLTDEARTNAGEDVAKKLLEHYWDISKGLDFSGNEEIEEIQKSKKRLEGNQFLENNWLGDGITNCLRRGTDRLKSVLDERDEPDGKISKVYWWTVDKESSMCEGCNQTTLLTEGVDALITNYPKTLKKVLQEDFSKQARLATFEDSPWEKYVENAGSNSSQEGNYTMNLDYEY